MGRHERMKRGSGMNDRDERSRGTEIRIADVFDIIKPSAPFKLAKLDVCLLQRIQRKLVGEFFLLLIDKVNAK